MIMMSIGSGLANMVFQYLSGWLFTYRSPNDIMIVMVTVVAVMCVHIVIMQVVASTRGSRFSRKDKLESASGERTKLIGQNYG